MRADDTFKAIQFGASGVIVSNHGGRQLDYAAGTIEVLPEVVRAADGRIPVFVDGGVRSGNDVFKAIALGAQAVFVGRPVLCRRGSEGVSHVLNILKSEFEYTMKLSGMTAINQRNQGNEGSGSPRRVLPIQDVDLCVFKRVHISS
ncbi:hypothetical protein L596_027567 [Steinernema carpocapsae]|uniref:FMN hydroxy acid dehydrogenase domain-containing protein n=1 Tax=Steinernema carpocapsae TaxID=34508 RepID=A0A4U5LVY6_STECR|nr:hypothetical protein L596_027567 [Steinernema carpocapsae]